eukprot:scaffold4800_cov47-Attheya_sp.AAC.2
MLHHIPELARRGVLHVSRTTNSPTHSRDVNHHHHHEEEEEEPVVPLFSWDDASVQIGFPLAPHQIIITTRRNDPSNPNPHTSQSSSSSSSSLSSSGLHGSTKTAAKRRLAALRRSFPKNRPNTKRQTKTSKTFCTTKDDEEPENSHKHDTNTKTIPDSLLPSDQAAGSSGSATTMTSSAAATTTTSNMATDSHDRVAPMKEDERFARQALDAIFPVDFEETTEKDTAQEMTKGDDDHGHPPNNKKKKEAWLPKRHPAAYAGSHAGRTCTFATLSEDVQLRMPPILMNAFGLMGQQQRNDDSHGTIASRRLYRHQAKAIDSAVQGHHTVVCTGTGSGKSLCFLLPILRAALMARVEHPTTNNDTSIIIFPTKALAQDQMAKLTNGLLKEFPDLQEHVRVGIIDGDTPHAQRTEVAQHANVILTNPDTLHAAILPGWKTKGMYKRLLSRLKYVVIDEAHMYEGVFGAHVAMVLARLTRLCAVSKATIATPPSSSSSSLDEADGSLPIFLACSATMTHPEHHFRALCPIPSNAHVTVLTAEDDGSPRAPKHFFVWNPPLMDVHGVSTGNVTASKRSRLLPKDRTHNNPTTSGPESRKNKVKEDICVDNQTLFSTPDMSLSRRHAADETAVLLARAMSQNVRTIAFCKSRSLVEWVYEATVRKLRSNPSTAHLVSKVESYRGGYTVSARRDIEEKLFQNHLLGVVATSALELGIDIGGIDLTLHCGCPTSVNSLLQQAGRAGRGATRLDVPSLAIMICFNSPAEQHIWRNPTSLLSRGRAIPTSLPINAGLVQGHLLCAGQEFPLTGDQPVSVILQPRQTRIVSEQEDKEPKLMNDYSLLGSEETFIEAHTTLLKSGSLVQERISIPSTKDGTLLVSKTHASIQKPWMRVSLRSIEQINYSIVDTSHPLQGGRMDAIHNEKAVMDTIPYSRVFYHAFPGAIIMHRGQKYKVQAMNRPPPFVNSNDGYNRRSNNLAAFAKPTTERYSTRPLSTSQITIVKQMERVDIGYASKEQLSDKDNTHSIGDSKSLSKSNQIETNSFGVVDGTTPLYQAEREVNKLVKKSYGSIAGNGIVTVKRSVHGYAKLSSVTRMEMSRTEISLPPMEFDTFAFWLDTEASTLRSILPYYDDGVHALSHALLAVAPLFVPCTSSDIDCDHSCIDCTRILLFDVRAGGSGTAAMLWKYLFLPNGLLDAAIDLLDECPSCQVEKSYGGGCPACLHSGQCIKFNEHLSKSAGSVIAKRMLQRLKQSKLYQSANQGLVKNGAYSDYDDGPPVPSSPSRQSKCKYNEQKTPTTPRTNSREENLRDAKHLKSARDRQIVVGRTPWPLDH